MEKNSINIAERPYDPSVRENSATCYINNPDEVESDCDVSDVPEGVKRICMCVLPSE